MWTLFWWHHQGSIYALTSTPWCHNDHMAIFHHDLGPVSQDLHWGGLTFQILFHLCWKWSPGARRSLSVRRQGRCFQMPALKRHILYALKQDCHTCITVREPVDRDRRREAVSCELPLVEERQHCNMTWIFLFNQTKNRWHFLTALLSSMLLLIWQNLNVCACSNWKKKSCNNFIMTYWLAVLLLGWPVLLQTIQVKVLTASLSSVYGIYILGKKIGLVLSVKITKIVNLFASF